VDRRPVQRRIDVTRCFARRPGERLTLNEVARHVGIATMMQVHDLLEELVATGWLRSGHDADHRTVYWREP